MRAVLIVAGAVLVANACGGSSSTRDEGSSGNASVPPAGSGGSLGASGSAPGGAAGQIGSAGSSGTGGTRVDAGAGGGGGKAGAPFAGSTAGGADAAGSGGSHASGTAGASGVSDHACRTAEDCTLSTDCCSCYAAGPGEPTSLCKAACERSACAERGLGAADVRCTAGRCVLAVSCDVREAQCEAPTPECEAGMLPSVTNGCWGPCTLASECSTVTSCEDCEAAGLACVTNEAFRVTHHCVSTPPECEQNPTCSCMNVCSAPFTCGAGDGATLSCVCLGC